MRQRVSLGRVAGFIGSLFEFLSRFIKTTSRVIAVAATTAEATYNSEFVVTFVIVVVNKDRAHRICRRERERERERERKIYRRYPQVNEYPLVSAATVMSGRALLLAGRFGLPSLPRAHLSKTFLFAAFARTTDIRHNKF